MLQPKEIVLKTQDGDERTYKIHKVPAIPMREIVATYPVANMPKVGEYKVSEEIMLKLMAYVVAITADGHEIQLTSRALVDNHVPDWEVLARLEAQMIGYNVSFFKNAGNFASWTKSAETSIPKILSTLMASLQASSQTEKQPS